MNIAYASAGMGLALLLGILSADTSARESNPLAGREFLLALQPSESPPPRQAGSAEAGGTAAPPVREKPTGQSRKGKSGLKPFKPSQQIPAGSGVSFPADI